MTKTADMKNKIKTTMLGHPKYRHKEEKRKLMKMTCKKLKLLEDPESVLCKAVLINNTLKYLQNTNGTININTEQHKTSNLENNTIVHSASNELDILNCEIDFPPPLSETIHSEDLLLNLANNFSQPVDTTSDGTNKLENSSHYQNDCYIKQNCYTAEGHDIQKSSDSSEVITNVSYGCNDYPSPKCDNNDIIMNHLIPLNRICKV